MRNKHQRALALLAVVALSGAACGDDSDTAGSTNTTRQSGPSLSITSPSDGATIKGNVVSLAVETKGIRVVKADGDVSGKTGHLHVFVDKDAVAVGQPIDRAPGIVHSADNPVVIPGLSAGEHTLTVVFGDGAHTRVTDASDTIKVTVDGPSLDATAPAALKAGEALSIDAKVEGVSLVKADGDTSGTTGHLHAFVDVPPVAPGEAIPTGNPAIIHSATSPISVTGLAPGEHTVWIVLGDGAHMAFKDSVRDKVIVTVT